MKTNQIVTTVVLLAVFSTASFFAGTKYQQNKVTTNFGNQRMLNDGSGLGQGMGRGIGNNTDTDTVKNRGQVAGFRQTVGEIISLDAKSITIKMADGSSKIVLISDSTTVNQSVAATKNDLKVGLNVAVRGDQNTDGSVTSSNIEINPHVATITPTVKQ